MNRRQLLSTLTTLAAATFLFGAATSPSFAAGAPLRLGVGLFQPDKDKNNATYRPLAEFLAQRLGRLDGAAGWRSWARLFPADERARAETALRDVGLLTRISLSPSPHRPVYGLRRGELYVDALAIPFDAARWEASFLSNWPAGSDAWLPYFQRIQNGPKFGPARAMSGGEAFTA